MAVYAPVPLVPTLIDLDSVEFQAIQRWPFDDSFVQRLLHDDVPQRMLSSDCRMWVYRDPAGNLVGLGTLDECRDWQAFTDGEPHLYLPLLAVNPTILSKGYGTCIVNHLIEEAALVAAVGSVHHSLFLDVYTTSAKAIKVYTACGFVEVSPQPIFDSMEGKSYIIMARRVTA